MSKCINRNESNQRTSTEDDSCLFLGDNMEMFVLLWYRQTDARIPVKSWVCWGPFQEHEWLKRGALDDIQISCSPYIICERWGPPKELWKSLQHHMILFFLQEGILMVPMLCGWSLCHHSCATSWQLWSGSTWRKFLPWWKSFILERGNSFMSVHQT